MAATRPGSEILATSWRPRQTSICVIPLSSGIGSSPAAAQLPARATPRQNNNTDQVRRDLTALRRHLTWAAEFPNREPTQVVNLRASPNAPSPPWPQRCCLSRRGCRECRQRRSLASRRPSARRPDRTARHRPSPSWWEAFLLPSQLCPARRGRSRCVSHPKDPQVLPFPLRDLSCSHCSRVHSCDPIGSSSMTPRDRT